MFDCAHPYVFPDHSSSSADVGVYVTDVNVHGADLCVHGADVCVHGSDVRVHCIYVCVFAWC